MRIMFVPFIYPHHSNDWMEATSQCDQSNPYLKKRKSDADYIIKSTTHIMGLLGFCRHIISSYVAARRIVCHIILASFEHTQKVDWNSMNFPKHPRRRRQRSFWQERRNYFLIESERWKMFNTFFVFSVRFFFLMNNTHNMWQWKCIQYFSRKKREQHEGGSKTLTFMRVKKYIYFLWILLYVFCCCYCYWSFSLFFVI